MDNKRDGPADAIVESGRVGGLSADSTPGIADKNCEQLASLTRNYSGLGWSGGVMSSGGPFPISHFPLNFGPALELGCWRGSWTGDGNER